MKKIFLFFLFFLFSTVIFGQTTAPTATPTPPKGDKDDVVVIRTNLIQIDVTVTDKKGNIVTDLTADDFEILENGEMQSISSFSFIELPQQNRLDGQPSSDKNSVKNAPPLPSVPTKLRSEDVRRTIALVVDDLGLSFGNTFFVRSALKKFVDNQMQPGDLVAIIRTGGGMGALQQFTSDKRLLYAAIEKIRFNLNGRVGISSFEPIRPSFKDDINAGMNAATGETRGNVNERDGATTGNVAGTQEDLNFEGVTSIFQEDRFTIGTLGATNSVIKGLRELPGRKAVILFSEGFGLMERDGNLVGLNSRIEGSLKGLVDLANRSSVVLYAIDPRGLEAYGFTAEDNIVGLNDNPFAGDALLRARQQKFTNTQQSLQYLTEETGGFAVINQNNINKGIERVLDAQKGYYLVGYQPDDEVFDPNKRRFNTLTVRVKRPDLKVRYRSGFFGITDSEDRALPKTSEQQLLAAFYSPFAEGQINLSLTMLFASDGKNNLFMRSFVHVKGDDLKFIEEADGWRKATFEILAATFGDNGEVVDTVNQMGSIKVKPEALQEIKEKGLVYSIIVPVKKPGSYQLRIALRDQANANIGVASQFIEVPNLKKKRLAMSGLVLESSVTREKRQKGETNIIQSDTQRDIAVRRFRAGTSVMFGASVYNASANSRLSTQFRIFHDNRQVFASLESPLNFNGQQNLQNVDIGSSFNLGRNMPAGYYVLQVIVRDLSKNGKKQFTTQSIDFEIVK